MRRTVERFNATEDRSGVLRRKTDQSRRLPLPHGASTSEGEVEVAHHEIDQRRQAVDLQKIGRAPILSPWHEDSRLSQLRSLKST